MIFNKNLEFVYQLELDFNCISLASNFSLVCFEFI